MICLSHNSRLNTAIYYRTIKYFALLFSLIALLLTFIPRPLIAEEALTGKDVRINFTSLTDSIDQAIVKENESKDSYAKELSQTKAREKIYKSELSALKVQYSVYSNLVIMPETQLKNLEQAFSENLSVQTVVNSVLSEFKEKKDRIKTHLDQADEQIRLNSEQLKAIMADKKSQAQDSLGLAEKLKSLLDLLNVKKEILSTLSSVYENYFNQYAEMGNQFASLSSTFDRKIKSRKKQDLLQRKKNVLFSKHPKEMITDVGEFLSLPRILFSKDHWTGTLGIHESSDYSYVVTLLLLFVFFQYAMLKGIKGIAHIREKEIFQKLHWPKMTFSIFERSFFLTGNIIFLSVCDSFFHIRLRFPMIEFIEQGLTIILLSHWAFDFLKLFSKTNERFPSDSLIKKLRQIVRLIQYFSLIYIVALWLLSGENILLVLSRMVFAVIMYLELHSLSKALIPCVAVTSIHPHLKQAVCSIPKIGYVYLFFGLIMDLSGYAQLALFLSASIGKTLLVGMWSILFFLIILEFKESGKSKKEAFVDESEKTSINSYWFFTLFYGLAWFCLSSFGLIYIWGGKQAAVQGIYSWYTTPILLGNLKFSLMGLSLALFFLMGTHLVVKTWRELFQKRLLIGSGMDMGVQESITTISVYVIWIIGILLALNAFGLNMTSITVVLGALGIGIGFGLQNIFNNFLSGIILLFERPIKVGDDIEINGIWANVRKINVRSTAVQTYDNATLIIPNSDFISSQVTNWSFQDRRIRRNITVGVGYDSDLDLVRTSLIEAAEKIPRVLKLPKPDVIFKDFGDNALVFVLRFWTRTEYFLAVESAIRFEIARLFRTRKIEISYPQRDLHIRSVDADLIFKHDVPPQMKSQAKNIEKDPLPPQ